MAAGPRPAARQHLPFERQARSCRIRLLPVARNSKEISRRYGELGVYAELHSGPQSVRFQHARAQVWDTRSYAGRRVGFAVVPEGLSIQQLYRYIEAFTPEQPGNRALPARLLAEDFHAAGHGGDGAAGDAVRIPPGAQRRSRSACFPRCHVGIGVRGVEPDYRLLRFALRFVAGGQRLTPILLFLGLALVLLRRSAH